jgi:large subunit ribosomal protein L21
MYAVIQTGGKQYRVAPNELIRVEKLTGEPGTKVAFDDVLMVTEGENVKVGRPTVAGARVEAEIVEQGLGEKLLIYKYKRRRGGRTKQGHRQQLTALRILNIQA